MTEAQLTRKFLSALQTARPKAVIFKFNDRTTSGIPDACVVDEFTVWIEFKKYPNRPTPLQANNIKRINNAGGRAIVMSFNGPQVRVDHDKIFTYEEALTYVLELLEGWDL